MIKYIGIYKFNTKNKYALWYELLVQNPSDILRGYCCKILKIDLKDGKLDFWHFFRVHFTAINQTQYYYFK